ncbi:hypothetical protein OCT63_13910 [Vibrio sp. RW]|uniref:hypothetical protein n=1 Tax=Vibrio sp. RW TaxID=2998833 RepID=UPI0022CDBACC|nr:hypothetical protein [Vibrio sp. RW]MDA0145315.1 hypothetical protein [Vibrio sp. RW]
MSITGDVSVYEAQRCPNAIDVQLPWVSWADLCGSVENGVVKPSAHPINDKAKSGKCYGAMVKAIDYEGWSSTDKQHLFRVFKAQATGQNFEDTWLYAGTLPSLTEDQAKHVWTEQLGKELDAET